MTRKGMPELDKLFQEIGTYRKSSEFFELFEFVKKFPHIAPFNAMLIHVQKPGSQYVATASEWESQFNRNITPGARPLVILRSFGQVSFVFELTDTYGEEPFHKPLLNQYHVDGEISEHQLRHLTGNLKCDGILYCERGQRCFQCWFYPNRPLLKRNENCQRKQGIVVESFIQYGG